MKNPGRARPLAGRITRRMILVQLVTLACFFGLILIPVFIVPLVSGVRNVHPQDPRLVDILERSLDYPEGGSLTLDQQPDLTRIIESYPDFWYQATTRDHQVVRYGDVPPEIARTGTTLDGIVSLQVIIETETESPPAILIRTVQKPGGPVQVAVGGGPTLGLSAIIQTITMGLMVTTFVVLAIASALTIPRLIRRELRGLNTAAAAAEAIDVDQRGIRIPESGLPAEVLTLVRAVNEALERLDDAHSRRERFLADAAHELRTPIAILSARIETAEPFAEKQKLLADVTRLGDLTNQLLDVQRLTLGDPDFVPIDLVELAASVVADLAPLAIAGGYELELDAPDDAVRVNGDHGSLSRALTNIVRNAINHGGNRGRILITVTRPATITVTDDGPGIPLDEQDLVFEPFHRSRPSSEGAGLGLSLVQNIVRTHGGEVTVGSSPTGGARFDMSLPPAS